MTSANLYLRLSDFRDDSDGFGGRERKLRAEAARLGWTVARVVIENDAAGEDGRRRGASAFKRQRITTPSGRTELRTVRPGFRSVLDDLTSGRASAVLAEDLSRVCRDVRDGEDLLDACAERGASARSLSGTLNLTDGGTGAEVMAFRMFLAHLNAESADKAWRVAQGRERTASAGHYGGGVRPFGYRPDPDAPAHAKTLLVVPGEADALAAAADSVLAGVSLKAIARDWRERGIPTVSGTAWTPDTLRGCLLSPSHAGLAAHTVTIRANGDPPRTVTTLHAARWPAIIDRETWQAVADMLNDPARKTSPGTEPRWLVSGIARCHCGEKVYVRGSGQGRPSYVCRGPQQHLRRTAPATDAHVSAVIIARLSRPDMRDLLRPPARPGTDAPALRKESAALDARRKAQVRMHAAGDLDDAELSEGLREIKRRRDAIAAALAAGSAPDPLAEFRDTADVAGVWFALPLARQRVIVKRLAGITLLPGRKGAPRRFDPATVVFDWSPSVA
jgi:DNA invertase Pin-like site-specific DNA recombinase